jgi:membrane protein
MVAMIIFPMTAVFVFLGAELNRGIFEFKRMSGTGLDAVAALSPVRGR